MARIGAEWSTRRMLRIVAGWFFVLSCAVVCVSCSSDSDSGRSIGDYGCSGSQDPGGCHADCEEESTGMDWSISCTDGGECTCSAGPKQGVTFQHANACDSPFYDGVEECT
jgi:hypothetical protein